jgi:dihydroorotase-like cyclic amidohydrolase
MIDLGLFVADSYDASHAQLEVDIANNILSDLVGGLVHLNCSSTASRLTTLGFDVSVDAGQLGSSEVRTGDLRFVTFRKNILSSPNTISALIAKCADLGVTLFLPSPYTDLESASPLLASRAGYRQVNYNLARAFLSYLCTEAIYYNCSLHIYGISSAEEANIIHLFKKEGELTSSIPAYIIAEPLDDFGYGYEGLLSPNIIDKSAKEGLLNAMIGGQVDAITSHHYIYSETPELDFLSADVGVSMSKHLPAALDYLKTRLGSRLYNQLSTLGPQSILER